MQRCLALLALAALAHCAASHSLSDPMHCPTARLKNGRVRARGRGRIIRYSCYDGFELVGNKYATCIRGSWDTPPPICVSTRCWTPATPRHAVVGSNNNGAILMYFCEPGYVLVGNAEIYCDGRQWNGTTPICRDSNATAPTSCDFEGKGLCWWEQDPKHNFDWTKHRFDTPSSHIGTGPTHDHTLGAGNDGYYIYIEASGKFENAKARIMSPMYNSSLTESGCFSFWYHMFGTAIGSLNVYFKPEKEESMQLMWSMSGNQGNQWLRGLFDLPTANSSFQIIIEGVRGRSYVSDIAVDDVALLQGDECTLKNATTPPVVDTGNDEAEVYNAMQTCQNRCVAEPIHSSDASASAEVCQCAINCAETSSCCPDFAEYCIFEVTDPADTTSPWAPETGAEAITESRRPTTTTTIATTTTTRTTTTTTTAAPTSLTTRATSRGATTTPRLAEPSKTSTWRTPTTRRSTSAPKRTTTETRALTTRTSKRTEPTTPRRRTTVVAKQTSEAPVLIEDTRQLEQTSAFGLLGILSTSLGVLAALALATAVGFLVFRRRQTYKRRSNGSAFSEDSDVRFLTSDEVLDFNLARPSVENDTYNPGC